MKVIQTIESIYETQKEINLKLKIEVDKTFNRIKNESWHYFSRVKHLESFALKLETGRFSKPESLEDFFACTLVVENLDQINKAKAKINEYFTLINQKPNNSKFTHKESSSFQFDDLRLYVTIKQEDFLPAEPLSKVIFEIQIKTFLQHAWSLATHNLIYKSDEINWPKERIAYQIKAMLEQAEVTISGVNNLISLPEVSKDNFETNQQKKILNFYRKFFEKDDLPKNLVGLSKNTNELIKALGLTISDLEQIIIHENGIGRGTNFKNLSPFLLIIQSIINQRKDLLEDYINSPQEKKFKIVLPKEIQIGLLLIKNESNIIKI